jgi:hypothetical protein
MKFCELYSHLLKKKQPRSAQPPNEKKIFYRKTARRIRLPIYIYIFYKRDRI